MEGKIAKNMVIFLLLLGFVSFCWWNRKEELPADAILVERTTVVQEETGEVWESDYPASLLPGEKINVNTASASDLERLPSIGAGRAAEIVAHREKNGRFERVEALMEVYGIGETILENMKPYITLD